MSYNTRSILFLLFIILTISLYTQHADATWPMADGSHNLGNGFADGYPLHPLKIHGGIDILGYHINNPDLVPGKYVVAARGGEIIQGYYEGDLLAIEVPGGEEEDELISRIFANELMTDIDLDYHILSLQNRHDRKYPGHWL